MNRRLVLAGLTVAIVGGGLAAPALATGPETNRHKLCVLGPTPVAPKQEGVCIWWDDPARSVR